MFIEIISITPDAEQVIELAGRTCYNSKFGNPEIIQRWIKSGHCYDKDTEVLTREGFIPWSEVTYNSELATVLPLDRTFSGFEKPISLVSYIYKGDMIRFNSKTVDLCVTPGHKLYCSLSSSSSLRINPEFKLLSADKVINCIDSKNDKPIYQKPLRMVTSAINSNKGKGNPLFKLYGLFIGDGHLNCPSTGRFSFHLKLERKIKYLKEICRECGVVLTEGKGNKYSGYYPGLEVFYNSYKEKTMPLRFLNMGKEDFNYFYEGLMNSDGSFSSTNDLYCSTSKELANRLQALFSINNLSHSIKVRTSNNTARKDLYTFHISRGKDKYPMFNDCRSKKECEVISYNDKVYCAQVSTGLLIVRRNNKVTLCGNCSVIEHASVTFRIEGISRSCSHQMVRHRISSISQESQRYVDGSDFEYTLPTSILGNGEAEDLVYALMADIRSTYEQLIKLGIKKEDARSVLPNATCTVLVQTFNFRSLRNFLKLRLSKHAQEEIRLVAEEMLKLVKPYAPNVFYDF